MSHFAEALHPDDVPPSHLGEWEPDDEPDETEVDDEDINRD